VDNKFVFAVNAKQEKKIYHDKSQTKGGDNINIRHVAD
jgi:hypothetical protein